MVPVVVVLFLLLTTLLVALLIWRWRHFSYFKELGILGPKPNLIWGNIREYHSKELYKVITKWLDQYGDVFGFYNGDVPFLVIRDLDFIEHVFVRNFHNFVDRGLTMMTDQMHPVLKKSIMHVGGSPWKSIRMCVAHGMSERKLKQVEEGYVTAALHEVNNSTSIDIDKPHTTPIRFLEKVTLKNLTRFDEKYKIIKAAQYGFCKQLLQNWRY